MKASSSANSVRVRLIERLPRNTSLVWVFNTRSLNDRFWADGSVVHVLDLGCFDAGDIEFKGSAATWSPDGRWIAVAQEKQILFQQLIGGTESGTWPVQAAGLGWLR